MLSYAITKNRLRHSHHTVREKTQLTILLLKLQGYEHKSTDRLTRHDSDCFNPAFPA